MRQVEYSSGMQQGVTGAVARLCSAALAFGVIALGAPSASADPPALPVFDGAMAFPSIQDPSGPEEFSWEVKLSEEQELQSIDEQSAEVRYKDGPRSYLIVAGQAHDAEGATVPTSLGISEGNVITLTVHHRPENPAAGGDPFVYPILAGPGWESDFHTVTISGPLDEQELREEQDRIAREKQEALEREWGKEKVPSDCLVPRLKGRSLKAAKKLLKDAKCLIGNVRKLKGITDKAGKVVKQSPKPGTILAPWTTVKVTLGN